MPVGLLHKQVAHTHLEAGQNRLALEDVVFVQHLHLEVCRVPMYLLVFREQQPHLLRPRLEVFGDFF